ncbi:hypothetical protein LEP1GSC060_3462 [Leptospira weilii serovar Ranarum str. ICFT]|uniref:Uncharacterized protein n=2 Tax=Leptospira weilii TaxID=28184 RepID=N1WHX2_9LEPT|nr:hypothetical protein LEP1GSC060_3462 [Leptospira weilii serovar Ranarum str. ICFT]
MVKNPYYKKAAPMKCYLLSRVSVVENSDSFKEFIEKNRKRISGSIRSIEKRKEMLKESIEKIEITVKEYPKEVLIKNAISSYNSRKQLQGFDEMANDSDSWDFVRRITENYVRHELTHYDKIIMSHYGKVGKLRAYKHLKEMVTKKIYEIYPWLKTGELY